MRVMRKRASLISAPVVFTIRAGWRTRADRCRSPHVMTDAYRPLGGNTPTAAVA